jgi:hypothetical protein
MLIINSHCHTCARCVKHSGWCEKHRRLITDDDRSCEFRINYQEECSRLTSENSQLRIERDDANRLTEGRLGAIRHFEICCEGEAKRAEAFRVRAVDAEEKLEQLVGVLKKVKDAKELWAVWNSIGDCDHIDLYEEAQKAEQEAEAAMSEVTRLYFKEEVSA